MRMPPDAILRPALIGTLAAWMALVVASGAFAAISFPAVRELSPLVPSMPVMSESHWKVVAGVPAQRNFRLVQAAGWALGIGSVLLALGCRGMRGPLAAVQWISHATAIALLAATQFIVMGPLDRLGFDLHEAMRRGDLEASLAIDRDFTAIHRLATPMMSAMLVALLLVAVAGLMRAPRPAAADTRSAP